MATDERLIEYLQTKPIRLWVAFVEPILFGNEIVPRSKITIDEARVDGKYAILCEDQGEFDSLIGDFYKPAFAIPVYSKKVNCVSVAGVGNEIHFLIHGYKIIKAKNIIPTHIK